MGIRTWASLEPVMDPDQSLSLIIRSAEWVDEFKVGKLNHVANKIDWKSFGKQAVALMKKLDKRYYLKKDLLAFLPGEPQRG
jgi:CCR4-NOT transcriptional regulation complex NOT5 subunit